MRFTSYGSIRTWVDESSETDDTLREALLAMISRLEYLEEKIEEKGREITSLRYEIEEVTNR